METKQKNTSIVEGRLDPGNVMRCFSCQFETSDVLYDACPQCGISMPVVYIGTQHGEGCRECTQIKPEIIAGLKNETYSVDDDRLGFYLFNVTQARHALSRLPVGSAIEVPRDLLGKMLGVNVTEPRHYPHIPKDKLDQPGIVCELELGNGYKTFVLIDGSHRAGIKMMEDKPYYAFLLTDDIARKFIIASNVGSIINEPPAE